MSKSSLTGDDVSILVEAEVRRALDRWGLLPGGILAALSGGLDSVCLLRLLMRVAVPEGGRIEVAHVDHGLRSGSSADADFSAALAEELGLPFHLRRLDSGELRGPGGVQSRARMLRRRFLEEVRADRGLAAIALGHHADDQVETVLYRLIRGTGPRGVSGMSEWAPPYLRPLLGVRRADLERTARARGWTFREDPTNRSTRYARNRLRHEALPTLRAVHPGCDRAVLRLARLLGEDDDYLSGVARDLLAAHGVEEPEGLRFPLGALRGMAPPLRRRLYLAAREQLGGDPAVLDARHLEAVEALLAPGRSHRFAPVPEPGAFAVSYGDLWVLGPEALAGKPGECRLTGPGRACLEGPGVEVVWGPLPEAGVPHVPVGRDAEAGGLCVRTWSPGDRIEVGRGSPTKVKDLLMEARLPLWRRRRALVVEDGSGPFGLLAEGRAWGGVPGGRSAVWMRRLWGRSPSSGGASTTPGGPSSLL